MKLYLAGPMTDLPDDNFSAFHEMAARLRAAGHEVVSPAENFSGRRDLPLEVYLRRDFADVLKCEALAILDGWESSRGGLKELLLTVTTGKAVYLAEELAEGFVAPLALGEQMIVKKLHLALAATEVAS